jgi:hypothetical protein
MIGNRTGSRYRVTPHPPGDGKTFFGNWTFNRLDRADQTTERRITKNCAIAGLTPQEIQSRLDAFNIEKLRKEYCYGSYDKTTSRPSAPSPA